MKATIFNLSLAVIVSTSSFFLGRMEAKHDITSPEVKQEVTLNDAAHKTAVYTRATYYNGEIIPVVDLPEVSISSERPDDNFVHATIQNGEVVPVVNLPEVKIEA